MTYTICIITADGTRIQHTTPNAYEALRTLEGYDHEGASVSIGMVAQDEDAYDLIRFAAMLDKPHTPPATKAADDFERLVQLSLDFDDRQSIGAGMETDAEYDERCRREGV